MHIIVHTTAALYRHQPSRCAAGFGRWSHDWRSGEGVVDEGEGSLDSDDNTGWDPARARRTPAEVEAEALRMGYVAPAERDDSSTGGSTVDLT